MVHSEVSLSQGLRWWDLRNRFSSWFSKWWWLWSVTWMNITEFKSFNDVSNDSIQWWLPSKPKLFIKMTWCAKRKDRVCISPLPKAFYLFLGELEKNKSIKWLCTRLSTYFWFQFQYLPAVARPLMLSVFLDKADRISLILPSEFHQIKVLTCILSRRNRNITFSKVFIFLIILNRSGIIEIDMRNEDSCFKKMQGTWDSKSAF